MRGDDPLSFYDGKTADGVSPACAGMIPVGSAPTFTAYREPRMRGDDPSRQSLQQGRSS